MIPIDITNQQPPYQLTLQHINIFANFMMSGYFAYRADESEEFVAVNQAVLKIAGCETEEQFRQLTGNSFRGFVHPDDLDEVEESIKQQIDSDPEKKDYVEYRHRSADGMVRWIHDYGHLMMLDDIGPVFGVFVYDHTDKHQRHVDTEQESLRLRNSLRVIKSLALAYDCIFYIDVKRRTFTTYSSSLYYVKQTIPETGDLVQAFDLFKYRLCAPEQFDAIDRFVDLRTLDERLKDRDVITEEFVGSTTGHWHEASFYVTERAADCSIAYMTLSMRDIDKQTRERHAQQRAIEEALEAANAANQAKTSFLFNMSHDIRTPMNAIMGFTNLLRKHFDDETKRDGYLDKIEKSSSVLLSIINNVLEMSRIEKGTVVIEEVAWSAHQLCDAIFSVFSEMMKQKGITFEHSIDVKHPYILCDSSKLRKIFMNLISNSYKYTNPGGHISLHIEEVPCPRAGYVTHRATLKDDGIGISEEFLPHLFEEFSRENNTTDNKIEGTGLGMSIVKRLVELMHGTIDVYSKKGEGTTVCVCITHKMALRSQLIEHSGVVVDPQLFRGKHLLLAEDNDLNAEIATELLEELGFVVDRAIDGAQCVIKLQKAPVNYFDAVLMDIQMPNMNGYEATQVIRSLAESSKANIPILAMTANAFEEDKRAATEAGMNGHLSKPINTAELLKALAVALA